MILKIINALNIRKEELSRIIFLIIQSLFFGVFISFYNTYISALFLSEFSLKFLAYGYLVSGIIGVILTYIYSFFIKKLPFKIHSTTILLLIFVFILLLKIGIDSGYSKSNLAFIGFVFYTPITSLITLVFSGLLMQLFNLRQGKRVFSLIATGAVIAAIISYLTIPILLGVFSNASNLLWFALISILIGGFIQFLLNNKYANYITVKKENSKEKLKINIFKNTYFKNIYILSIFSMAGLILISYSFLSASKVYFIQFEVETLGIFFGLFFGITKAIEFVMNTFISGKLLEKNGLKFGLSTLPKVILILSCIALASSILSFYFPVFKTITFILMVISMLALVVIKRSIEDSAFKLLFQPLSSKIKPIVQSSTEGKARQIGAIAIGIILVIMQLLVRLEHLQTVSIGLLILICIGWLKSLFKVSEEYKIYISKELDILENTNLNFLNTVQNIFKTLNNVEFESNTIQNLVLPGLNYLKEDSKTINIEEELLYLNDTSRKKIDHINFIHKNWSVNYYYDFLELIEDTDFTVVKYLIYTLKDEISSKDFINFTNSLKIDFNTRFPFLLIAIDFNFSNYFEKNLPIISTKNRITNLLILNIIVNLKENKNEVLLKNIDTKDKEIEDRILNKVLKSNTSIFLSNSLKIKNKIREEASNYTWLIFSIIDLSVKESYIELLEYLRLELDKSIKRIFKLASLIYKKEDVFKILNIILQKNSEKKVLALEMVDLTFEEEFKEFLIPIVDDITFQEKKFKLNKFFPNNSLAPQERLKNLLNSEFYNLNIIIRLECIKLLSLGITVKNIPVEILSNLFHKDILLKHYAYFKLLKIAPEKFTSYSQKEASNSIISLKKLENKNYVDVSEILIILKKSLFFKDATIEDIVKILRITENKLYTSENLSLLRNKDIAVLMIQGDIDIDNVYKDLYILNALNFNHFVAKYNTKSKFLKIDLNDLAKILALSENSCFQK